MIMNLFMCVGGGGVLKEPSLPRKKALQNDKKKIEKTTMVIQYIQRLFYFVWLTFQLYSFFLRYLLFYILLIITFFLVDLKNMKLSKKEKSDVEAGKSSSGEKIKAGVLIILITFSKECVHTSLAP